MQAVAADWRKCGIMGYLYEQAVIWILSANRTFTKKILNIRNNHSFPSNILQQAERDLEVKLDSMSEELTLEGLESPSQSSSSDPSTRPPSPILSKKPLISKVKAKQLTRHAYSCARFVIILVSTDPAHIASHLNQPK